MLHLLQIRRHSGKLGQDRVNINLEQINQKQKFGDFQQTSVGFNVAVDLRADVEAREL